MGREKKGSGDNRMAPALKTHSTSHSQDFFPFVWSERARSLMMEKGEQGGGCDGLALHSYRHGPHHAQHFLLSVWGEGAGQSDGEGDGNGRGDRRALKPPRSRVSGGAMHGGGIF